MVTTKHIKAIIRLRRATEEQWIEKNPIPRLGEPCYSIDKNKLKIGDGVKHWQDLEYLGLSTEEIEELLKDYARKDYFYGGDGIEINNGEISVEDLILDCGTSTTNV